MMRRVSNRRIMLQRAAALMNEHVIARELKSAVKDLVANELWETIEESLNDILRKLLHNPQSGIHSGVYNVVDEVMLNLLHKDVILDTLDGHVAKIFDTEAAADRLSKRFLTSSTFMESIATFMRSKTYTTMAQQKFSTTVARKDPMDTVETYKDDDESSPSRKDSGSDELNGTRR